MTNQLIKRYQLPGRTDNTNMESKLEQYRRIVTGMMKDEGFVPLLDLVPVFTWEWAGNELYDFVYTWQGVFVGKDKAWQIEGVSAGKRIPIPNRK